MSNISLSELYPPTPSTTKGHSIQLSARGDNILYCNNKSVIIRSLSNPSKSQIYSQHTAECTAARFSPSGYFIASADISGKVRIWDSSNYILKNEYKFIQKVTDVAWDGESKRIICVGEGKERFGHCFTFDSGNSVGEIVGHSKPINSVAIRKVRPIRAVTCGDDGTLCFYNGTPFKFVKTLTEHNKFVNCVKFSADDSVFTSVGSDGLICVYDAVEGNLRGKEANAHSGSIYACAWSQKELNLFATCSSDCTVKVWDAKNISAQCTFTLEEQQVGIIWTEEYLVSVGLSGDLYYLDKQTGKILKRITGHQKAITAVAVGGDGRVFTGSYDGRIVSWSNDGNATIVDSHDNQVNSLYITGNFLYSVGMDDSLHVTTLGGIAQKLKLENQPTNVVTLNQNVVVSTLNSILLFNNGTLVTKLDLGFTTTAIASVGELLAIGNEQSKVLLYEYVNGKFQHKFELTGNRGTITSLAYSAASNLLAVGDTQRNVHVFSLKSQSVSFNFIQLIESRWTFHNAKITDLSWSVDGQILSSASLDTDVILWKVGQGKIATAKGAHTGSVVGIKWLPSGQILSVGLDGVVRIWNKL